MNTCRFAKFCRRQLSAYNELVSLFIVTCCFQYLVPSPGFVDVMNEQQFLSYMNACTVFVSKLFYSISSRPMIRRLSHLLRILELRHGFLCMYSYAPHNDVSVNDGSHIRQWPHNIIIIPLCYNCLQCSVL
jgi:hypothetical protein